MARGYVPRADTKKAIRAQRRRAKAARWRVCLHEAGHLVAALDAGEARGLRMAVRAAILDRTETGLTICGPSFPLEESAVQVACGTAAERLAGTYAPPARAPAAGLVQKQLPADFAQWNLRTFPPESRDGDTLVKYLLALVRKDADPGSLTKWAGWIAIEVESVMARREYPILAAARRLYAEGFLKLSTFWDLTGGPAGTRRRKRSATRSVRTPARGGRAVPEAPPAGPAPATGALGS